MWNRNFPGLSSAPGFENTRRLPVDEDFEDEDPIKCDNIISNTVNDQIAPLSDKSDEFLMTPESNANEEFLLEIGEWDSIHFIDLQGRERLNRDCTDAVDIDSGTNGEIKYFIDSVDADVTDTFEMADNSGILTTKELLDADSATTQYSFRIRAEDSATLVKSSFVSVFIIVLGQNEDIPEFNQSIYTTIIEEELSEKANFLKLLAMETDSNAIITYDIVDSGAKYYFNVNPTSGDLSLINPLDREEFEDFTFTVVASDSDSPPRQGFSTVKIIISDINDNPPIFLLSQYSVTISESTTGVIISITAIDSDATFANSEISYVITDSGLPFAINMVSGEISVSGEFLFVFDKIFLSSVLNHCIEYPIFVQLFCGSLSYLSTDRTVG
ncbi:Cadherin EGF LAG seven-pass G-type receptor 3-like [Oopsacas minuta]|uniref:Cadherin EGF LAG seven-pass G-type receptor 3-like n=1 Tax=Oopsacas minuta TaxID=111878 RepID=A0AAV7K819_9METZ|nr:Cadherin EGF LAG seven-pass G-type receptor 3-like [Oopsacas minuta]